MGISDTMCGLVPMPRMPMRACSSVTMPLIACTCKCCCTEWHLHMLLHRWLQSLVTERSKGGRSSPPWLLIPLGKDRTWTWLSTGCKHPDCTKRLGARAATATQAVTASKLPTCRRAPWPCATPGIPTVRRWSSRGRSGMPFCSAPGTEISTTQTPGEPRVYSRQVWEFSSFHSGLGLACSPMACPRGTLHWLTLLDWRKAGEYA